MADNQTNYNDASPGDVRYDNAAFERFFKEQFTPLCAWCRYQFGFDIDVSKPCISTFIVENCTVFGYFYTVMSWYRGE